MPKTTQYLLQRAYEAAVRNRSIRDAVYGAWNRQAFTDVFEHERMLADRVRVDAYAQAIDRLVAPGDVVVDLGTGTGILAMLAARRARQVYAIDHSPFIDVAERIAAHNGFTNITFVQQHSTAFLPTEPIDVILHEQMGDELLNENMLDNLLDLRNRVLAQDGRILPGRFEFFVEPVALVEDRQVPFLWDMQVHGIDFGFLRGDAALTAHTRKCYGWRRVSPGDVAHYLGAPEPALRFDLATLRTVDEVPRDLTVLRQVTTDGWFDGFCIWFRAHFDDRTVLSTAPLDARTSWTNRLVRTPRRKVGAGEEIRYRVHLDDFVRPGTWTIAEDDD